MCSTFPERKQKKKRWRRPSSPTMTNITGWHTAMSTTSRMPPTSYKIQHTGRFGASTWVYRILLNEIFRTCKTKPEQISLDTMREEQGSQAEPFVEDSYTDIDLTNAMETLSPEDKMVIQLRYYEDLKLEQIAEILQENVSTVKSRLYRSMKKLRIAYAGEES